MRRLIEKFEDLERDLVEEGEITEKWISGIRKWWKDWINKAGSVPTRRGAYSYELAMKYLNEGEENISKLRKDLFYSKGAMPNVFSGDRKEDEKTALFFQKHLKKQIYLFDDANEEIEEIRGKLHFAYLAIYVKNSMEYAIRPDMREERWGKSGHLDGLDSYIEMLPEEVKRVDNIVSRKLLGGYSKIVKKTSEFFRSRVLDRADTEFSIGKAKVIVDISKKGDDLKAGVMANREAFVSSTAVKRYTKGLIKAEALIRKAGFGKVWYGNIYVLPESESFEFLGSRTGKVMKAGAYWSPKGDYVVFVMGTKKSDDIAKIMAHELGHRWYYKFMSQGERRRFDSYFGEVSAVTDYGSEKPSEDFAEVFEWYIMGDKLTRDQRERFKEFAIKGHGIKRQEDKDFRIERLQIFAEKIDTFVSFFDSEVAQ